MSNHALKPMRAVTVVLSVALRFLRLLLWGSVLCVLLLKFSEWLDFAWLPGWIPTLICALIVVVNAVSFVNAVASFWNAPRFSARDVQKLASNIRQLESSIQRTRLQVLVPALAFGIVLQFSAVTTLDSYPWWAAVVTVSAVHLAGAAFGWLAWRLDPARRTWQLEMRFYSPNHASADLITNATDKMELLFGEWLLLCCLVNRLLLISDAQTRSEIGQFLLNFPEDQSIVLGENHVEFVEPQGDGLMYVGVTLRHNSDVTSYFVHLRGQFFAVRGFQTWGAGAVSALTKYLVLRHAGDVSFTSRLALSAIACLKAYSEGRLTTWNQNHVALEAATIAACWPPMEDTCPACGAGYNITPDHVGRVISCKHCEVMLAIGEDGIHLAEKESPGGEEHADAR